MSIITPHRYDPWPELPYQDFSSTQYLLHRVVQTVGKLKLTTPFEPHWSNVALWITSQGLTSGPISYGQASYTIDIDLIRHELVVFTSWGGLSKLKLESMSVAQFIESFLRILNEMDIVALINLMPQEVPNPIAFDKDTEIRQYQPELANAWLRILISSYRVMQRYHARYYGITPPIGLMWGTMDLRDARYKGLHIPTEGVNSGYIRRNSMDDSKVEVGWWSGNLLYPRPAYYSFIYPEPLGIDQVEIKPAKARWDNALREFILDYDDVRTSQDPEKDLLAFFDSTYMSEAEKAAWERELLVSGTPV